jgi:periplasmic copper chaperone A
MKKQWTAALLLGTALAAQAQTAPVTVEGAWVRPSVQGQATTGAYLTITAREPMVLIGASTPVAAVTEVHELKMDGDVMRMRAVDGLPVAPGKPLELKPGGYHLMLQQLKLPLQPQTRIPLTLRFRNATGAVSEVQVSAPVAVARPSP